MLQDGDFLMIKNFYGGVEVINYFKLYVCRQVLQQESNTFVIWYFI